MNIFSFADSIAGFLNDFFPEVTILSLQWASHTATDVVGLFFELNEALHDEIVRFIEGSHYNQAEYVSLHCLKVDQACMLTVLLATPPSHQLPL